MRVHAIDLVTAALALVAVGVLAGAEEVAPATTADVVVTDVEEGSAAARAGLRPDDVVLSWTLVGSSGEPEVLGSILDWWWLTVEQRPRGVVRLEVDGCGETRNVELAPSSWGVAVRPQMEGKLLEAWAVGRRLMDSSGEGPGSERSERGAELWRVGGLLAQAEGNWQAAWWLFLSLGNRRADAGEWEAARQAYEKSLEVAEENHHDLARVEVWLEFGDLARLQEDLAAATAAYRTASEAARPLGEESLVMARCQHLAGRTQRLAGELEAAAASYGEALAIRSSQAPASFEHAETLMGLSGVAAQLGDDTRAAELQEWAMAILRQLGAPTSL